MKILYFRCELRLDDKRNVTVQLCKRISNAFFMLTSSWKKGDRNVTAADMPYLSPIWGILGTELASFLDKKSRVTFSVLMTSYLTEFFLFHNNLKLR